MESIIIENYKFNKDLLNNLKKEVKAKYKVYESFMVEYRKMKGYKKYNLTIPPLGIVNNEFQLHYKTSGLIRFDSFLFIDMKTRQHIFFN